jgi:CDP-glucose 4,6-dehydratase
MINHKLWKNNNVLITGHTGFKGGWLSFFLKNLGVNISGYALNPLGKNNFFNSTKLNNIFSFDFRKNLLDYRSLKKCLDHVKPKVIFHLAAQSSVIESFRHPKNTILTNVIGTMNLLECIKNNKNVKAVIIVTTDKVYKIGEKNTKFKEDSSLGGKDVYSASKASCEIITHSYLDSFFKIKKINVATVRAGNCIGGGDWTKDRIIKDCMESFLKNKKLIIRKPHATRPWQHVLEPLRGYIILAQKLMSNEGKKYVGAWNFGPNYKSQVSVLDLAKKIKKKIKSSSRIIIKKEKDIIETDKLNIDSFKSKKKINWKTILSVNESLDLTVAWYVAHYNKYDMSKFTQDQIKSFLNNINR